jgi:hypothetical protein
MKRTDLQDGIFFIGMFLVLCLLSIGHAQTNPAYNYRVYPLSITGFSYDSLKTTTQFPTGNYEGLTVIVKVPTTIDSAKFVLCYQRGYIDYDGSTILWKRPSMVVDTFFITAGNYNAAGTMIDAGGADTNKAQAIDSVQQSGYTFMIRDITPYRSPYGRFFIKGLTGNKHTQYTVSVVAVLTRYLRVDVGTSKQPND